MIVARVTLSSVGAIGRPALIAEIVQSLRSAG
jgi:hypothetical protein